MNRQNQYNNVIRPNVKFSPEEDLELDDYINSIRLKMKIKIRKGDFIKQCVFYCKKKNINPLID
jgi:hypothetical protein